MEKKSIINWLNQLVEDGNEITMKWDGGGDSGWVYFEVDGETIDNEYTRALVDQMDNTLDYGSWAGEFNSNGKAIYDHETRTFEGTDYYSEDSHDQMECQIVIKIPKSFWFDTFHVECEANYDDNVSMAISFLVKNGFLTDQHTEFCTNLENILADEFEVLFNSYESTDAYEFRGCNDSWIINRSEFKEEGDMLVYTIDHVEIQTIDREDKYIVLEVTSIAEEIDQTLNYEENAN